MRKVPTMIDTETKAPEVRMLRMPEVTLRLGISRPTLYRMIERKEFPKPVRVSRSSRWPEDEVSAAINEMRSDR